jgi:hypothetical protein
VVLVDRLAVDEREAGRVRLRHQAGPYVVAQAVPALQHVEADPAGTVEPRHRRLVAAGVVGHELVAAAVADALRERAPDVLHAVGGRVAAEHPHDVGPVAEAPPEEPPVRGGVVLGDELADLRVGPHGQDRHDQPALGRLPHHEVDVVPVVVLLVVGVAAAVRDGEVVEPGAVGRVAVLVGAGAAGLREDRDGLDHREALVGTCVEVVLGLGPREVDEQAPRRVAEPEERPALAGERAPVGGDHAVRSLRSAGWVRRGVRHGLLRPLGISGLFGLVLLGGAGTHRGAGQPSDDRAGGAALPPGTGAGGLRVAAGDLGPRDECGGAAGHHEQATEHSGDRERGDRRLQDGTGAERSGHGTTSDPPGRADWGERDGRSTRPPLGQPHARWRGCALGPERPNPICSATRARSRS